VLLQRGRAVLRYGAAAGVFLGLALLTKISGAILLAAFLAALAFALVRKRDAARVRPALQGTALAVAVAIAIAICGAHYTRHKILYGKFVLTTFDIWVKTDPAQKVPYLDHRTLSYVLGWDDDIFDKPYSPTGTTPHPRFWPVLLATSFADYYNFSFVPMPTASTPQTTINNRVIRLSALAPMRRSVAGGAVLALLAALAWVVATRTLFFRGDHPRLFLLFIAAGAVAGQLHFAIKYPSDHMGLIKGVYLQFAEPVYCALTGLAMATLWNRRCIATRVLAVAAVGAIALVASYSLFARVVVPLGPGA